MQSFLQYRRFGKALDVQLQRNEEKLAELRRERQCQVKPQLQQEESSLSSSIDDPQAAREAAVPEEYEGERILEGIPPTVTITATSSPLAKLPQQLPQYPSGSKSIEDVMERPEAPEALEPGLQTLTTDESTGSMLDLKLVGIHVQERRTQEDELDLGKVFLVLQSDNDPTHPYSWSRTRRIAATFILSLIGAIVGWASSIDSTIVSKAALEFGVGEVDELFSTGIFLIGFGVGALVSGPFSETVGRNPIYIATLIFYMLFLMGASLSPNLASQLICRFFSGFFGATPLVCAGGSLSDLWTPEERVFAFPMFACLSFAGPMLGPIFGGLISSNDNMNWRWVEWITLMVSGLVLAIVILFQPETFGPILLKWKAEHLRRLTGDGRYRSAIEIKKMSLAYRLLQSLYRPIVMTAQEPIIILLGLYLTVVYIVLFTFLTGYTFIYMDIYHFSTAMMGLSFLGIVIGIISCAPLIPLNMNLRKRDIARAQAVGPGTRVAPESRLYWAMFGAPAIPISLFWMGWTAQASISVWSPLIASVLFGFGILCIFISCYQYIIDSYEIYAASALASVTMIRYIVSGVMVEVSIPFYRNMGVAHTLTILGSLSTLLFPIPYALYRYGPIVRKKSKYAFFIDD